MNNKKKVSKSLQRFVTWTIFFIVPIYVVFSSTQIAQAGLFSFIFDWIDTGHASTLSSSNASNTNSQTMRLLSSATNQNPNPDNVFEVIPTSHGILIPDIAVTNSAISTESVNTQISVYTVHAGDTIASVAKLFSVSVNTILWANNLNSHSVLQQGQTLVILPITGINYTVVKGDTVSSLAKKFGADHVNDTLQDILDYNDLTSASTLTIGQTIIIPDAELSSVITSTPNPSTGFRPTSSVRKDGTSPLLDNISILKSYPSCTTVTAGCYYLRPVEGGYESQGPHGHNGVDLAVPIGTPIHATAGGTVIISRITGAWNGGYGNYVVISHDNGTQSVYAHMQQKQVVTAGQHVDQGDLVGYVGMSGNTTGPHVHFEIRGARNPF